jgi:flagellar protein FliO/FliZ
MTWFDLIGVKMGARQIQRVIAISVLLMSGAVGFAQATQPAVSQSTASQITPSQIAPGKYDDVQLGGNASASRAAPATSQQAADDSSSGGPLDYERVIFALAIVVGLIFVTRWVSKKLFPGAVAARSTGAMKVMSRLVISPKQQLLMVQVGRRIVVVGDSGGNMAPVSEITDPDEVASLVAQLAEDKSIQLSRGFGSLFNRASGGFDSPSNSDVVEDDVPASTDSPSAEEPAISDARGEISGLMDKVRLLSSQFRRS